MKEIKKKPVCFLGGTCAESTWRDELIQMLKIDYFDPVVEDWTPECQEEELRQREECDYCLYVLTPRMQGYYSIAEVVDDSNKRPEKTVFCVLDPDGDYSLIQHTWNSQQMKSFEAIKKLVAGNGGTVCDTLREVADFLNK